MKVTMTGARPSKAPREGPLPSPNPHDLNDCSHSGRNAAHHHPPASPTPPGVTPWGVQFRYDEVLEDLDQDAALDVADAAVRWAVQTIEKC